VVLQKCAKAAADAKAAPCLADVADVILAAADVVDAAPFAAADATLAAADVADAALLAAADAALAAADVVDAALLAAVADV
jgi:hypothetical protein